MGTTAPTPETPSDGLLTGGATLAAILLFVVTGGLILPQLFGFTQASGAERLVPVFLLNIALILFGWRRSSQLAEARAARLKAECEAEEAAFLDGTTRLWNRRGLLRLLDDLPPRGSPLPVLLHLELHEFRRINELQGHAAGDRLLRHAADVLREVAPADAPCARIGADDFAILVPGRSAAEADRMAQALLVRLSASIGLCPVDLTGADRQDALRRSEMALADASRLGGRRASWFDAAMEDELLRRGRLESDLRTGITEHQFVPYFQPLVSLRTGALKGFEVLARWEHPQRGLLAPAEFVTAAEAAGLIGSISLAVARTALEQALRWPGEPTIAINISPVHFKDPLLAARILKIIAETGFPAHRLEVEITESSLLEDNEAALATVESLQNQGVRIALDDFGTGYASLTQLRALPFDRIKIDKSFVETMLEDRQSRAIVAAVARLGSALDLPVTAEGVETELLRATLAELGCSEGQGYLFGKPMPALEVEEQLRLRPETGRCAARG